MSEIKIMARPRRNRKSAAIRNLVQETTLLTSNLILPLFVMEGKNQKVGIKAMPGVERLTRDNIVKIAWPRPERSPPHLGAGVQGDSVVTRPSTTVCALRLVLPRFATFRPKT